MNTDYMNEIDGYSECCDLIRGNWIYYNGVWKFQYYPTLSKFGDVVFIFSITMVDSFCGPNASGLQIKCENPIITKIPGCRQISGLSIEFEELIKSSGHERNIWRLDDFENGEIAVKCDKISLSRIDVEMLYGGM